MNRDDDNTKADQRWLEGVGFAIEQIPEQDEEDLVRWFQFGGGRWKALCARYIDGTWSVAFWERHESFCEFAEFETRGQFRRLLEALGLSAD